jgi:hypothetical protein
MLVNIPMNFKYYCGPFYWVSNKAIQAITTIGLNFIYEDMSVGYAISLHPELTSFANNSFFKSIITIDDGTET